MPHLFSPLALRSLTFKNRIFVSPMCMYSSDDGLPTDFHLVHLGSRAVGGAALVMVEATAVTPEGRITPFDSGIWSEAHASAFQRITKFIADAGAVPAIQLAHAGRKASTDRPWLGGHAVPPGQGGWTPVAPSPLPFDDKHPTPHELSPSEIESLVTAFATAARRSLSAGFKVIELHFAHGYLAHSFLSPLSNHRTDAYGGSLENRMRFPLEITRAARDVWPNDLPLFVRISATDWADNGWDLPQSVELSKRLKSLGVDLIDCSSGGLVPHARIPTTPGYQVPFAQSIKKDAQIPTAAVGLITTPAQATAIIEQDQADAILLARAMLNDPYWPLHAAQALGHETTWPPQYTRAKPRR